MRRSKLRISAVFFYAFILLSLLLSGCAGEEQSSITDIRQLDGKSVGVMTGSAFDQYTDQFIQDAKKNITVPMQIWQYCPVSSQPFRNGGNSTSTPQ